MINLFNDTYHKWTGKAWASLTRALAVCKHTLHGTRESFRQNLISGLIEWLAMWVWRITSSSYLVKIHLYDKWAPSWQNQKNDSDQPWLTQGWSESLLGAHAILSWGDSNALFMLSCNCCVYVFRMLCQFAFNLSMSLELPKRGGPKKDFLREGLRDMLIKHHLFSWDI